MAAVLRRVREWNPFKTAETRRLATLFAVVYFAQGMWSLPVQPLTIVLKERGLTAGQVADFMLIGTLPWLVKPLYGLLSDFVPLFGRRRKSYFLVTSLTASAAGFALAAASDHTYWLLAVLYAGMGLGLAFTDVVTDALMVENGRARGLTGAFQSVQWAAIYSAAILVGVVGGHFAELRNLHATFALAGCFPLVSAIMATLFVHEARAAADRAALAATTRATLAALRGRHLWLVAAFIFLFNFSPSFGPAFLFYQTDVLGFGQRYIGLLTSLNSVGWIAGAIVYAPLSRRLRLRTTIVSVIGLSATATLGYLAYRGPASAVAIELGFGMVAMVTQLAFLDLAAKACPPHVEGTFFALLMSVYNAGTQLSMNVGGRLYDWVGFTPLVLISAAVTALAWALVPLVRIDEIEARAREAASA